MLSKLTLEQKIKLLGGHDSMFTYAMPSIDLPSLKMSDASVGVRTWGPTIAYAGGVALAATWDPEFARELGEALGRDARARGVNFLLGPGVNIARSPVNGRNFEYLSEDPYLNSRLVVPYIDGVQSQGVSATVKHYALNNSEFDRHNIDAIVDERTMRELYLPAFEAAVKQGHVGAVMDSYNLVNGEHSTQNKFLNLEVLKGDWGFKGVLMSDWTATYDGVAAANGGLDLEMPYAAFMNEQTLLPAVKDGRVKESTIDDKVLRLLRTELRFGWDKRPQLDPVDATYSTKDRPVALRGALESVTLLKNEGHLLPLDATKIKTIAVIGPNAWPAVTGGGGSSYATAFAPVSLVAGIGNLLGPDVSVLYANGLPSPQEIFRNTRWASSIQIEQYDDTNFSGTPTTGTVDGFANWHYVRAGQVGSPHSVRYTASFTADKAGKYLLLVASNGNDVYKVDVDGKQVIDQKRQEGGFPKSAELDLAAGQTAHIVANYVPHAQGLNFAMGLAYEPDMISPEAREFASNANAVVLSVGFDHTTESEGFDRTFDLPWGQAALVEAIAPLNPHTIVVLNGGGGMNVMGWLDKVSALVDAWYPGQEGGTAVADVLFGKHDPEGRLPISWDRAWSDNPSAKWYYGDPAKEKPMESTWGDGKMKTLEVLPAVYGDKLMVGYRYWTTVGKKPLFPFGYGLSYTTFKFSNLHVPTTAQSGQDVPVSFDVTNTGSMKGAEVAQLYVSDPSATVNRPERELKGFEKVRLDPGQTRHVTLELNARSFSYWDEATHNWKTDPGRFVIRVGDSSEDTPLTANLTLQ